MHFRLLSSNWPSHWLRLLSVLIGSWHYFCIDNALCVVTWLPNALRQLLKCQAEQREMRERSFSWHKWWFAEPVCLFEHWTSLVSVKIVLKSHASYSISGSVHAVCICIFRSNAKTGCTVTLRESVETRKLKRHISIWLAAGSSQGKCSCALCVCVSPCLWRAGTSLLMGALRAQSQMAVVCHLATSEQSALHTHTHTHTHTHRHLCSKHTGEMLHNQSQCANAVFDALLILNASNWPLVTVDSDTDVCVCVCVATPQSRSTSPHHDYTLQCEKESTWKGWMGVCWRREIVAQDMRWKSECDIEKR